MFSLARLRCLGSLRLGSALLGLVLLAQAAAVVPLIGISVQHAFENAQDIAADLSFDLGDDLADGGATVHVHHHHVHHDGGRHDHGGTDPNDPCCTLQHLTGVLPVAVSAGRNGLTASVAVVPFRSSLAGIDPAALERPPKPLLSI
jgi:hypothetical protein